MSKTKRIQVPLSAEDEKLIRSVAKLYKISAAEWLRRVALKAVERDRSLATARLEPEEALAALSNMNLPISSLKKMTKESILGRLVD
jgi:replication initiation and membrane attachment protein DnaB